MAARFCPPAHFAPMRPFVPTRPSLPEITSGLDLLRFPLIVGVVMVHCNFLQFLDPPLSGPATAAFVRFHDIFKHYVLDLCVPAVFAISGFLFFRDGARLSARDYTSKLRRRVRSLLVPYLLWNLIGFALFLVKHRAEQFDVLTLLAGFFCRLPADPFPYDFPLWFVRNLLIIAVFSPLLSALLRLARGAAPLVPLALCVLSATVVPGHDRLALLPNVAFFTLGASLACYGRRLLAPRALPAWGVLYLAAACACVAGGGHMAPWEGHALWLLAATAGVATMLTAGIAAARGGRVRTPRFLAGATFFLYGFHGLFSVLTCRTVTRLLPPASNAACFADYALIFAVLFGVSMLAYAAVRRMAPRLLPLLGCRMPA